MKKTLGEIKSVITKEAHNKRESAAYGGEWGDGGASQLEGELNLFMSGVKATVDVYIDKHNKVLSGDTDFEVPKQWEKFFIKEDEEYEEYLRLKNKFK